MTTAHNIDLPAVLAERLTTTHPDVLRELLATFIHTLMGAEADALCGAGYGERSTERTNSRNGYRHRQFDTRAGSLDLAIPKLRQGSYFPEWLPFPRRTSQAPGWERREGRPSHRVKSSTSVGWAARRSRCAAPCSPRLSARSPRSHAGVDLRTTNPGPQRLRGADPQHAGHRGDRRPLRGVLRAHLGDHAHCTLTKLVGIVAARTSHNSVPQDPETVNYRNAELAGQHQESRSRVAIMRHSTRSMPSCGCSPRVLIWNI